MQDPRTSTLGALLAAGEGTRFAGPTHKLLAPLRGSTVIDHAVRALAGAGFAGAVVVTGAVDVSSHLAGLAEVHNPSWRTGQRSSVVRAIEQARENGFDAVVIGLADQPFVDADAWRAVAECDSPIAVATYDGRRGNPVKLSRAVWDEFLAFDSDPDKGARPFIDLHPELVREVACKGTSADIDTEGDLAQWT